MNSGASVDGRTPRSGGTVEETTNANDLTL